MFKLGTSNFHQIRHKVTTIKMLPYQHTGFQSLSALNKTDNLRKIARCITHALSIMLYTDLYNSEHIL